MTHHGESKGQANATTSVEDALKVGLELVKAALALLCWGRLWRLVRSAQISNASWVQTRVLHTTQPKLKKKSKTHRHRERDRGREGAACVTKEAAQLVLPSATSSMKVALMLARCSFSDG